MVINVKYIKARVISDIVLASVQLTGLCILSCQNFKGEHRVGLVPFSVSKVDVKFYW